MHPVTDFRPVRRVLVALLVLAFVVSAVPAAAAQGVVNINTADETQLTMLPRIGPSIAARIVEHREANGAFGAAEELMLVRGIGEKTYTLLEPYVVVEGDTTLSEKVRASRAEGGDPR